jgi:hypothetical protein
MMVPRTARAGAPEARRLELSSVVHAAALIGLALASACDRQRALL